MKSTKENEERRKRGERDGGFIYWNEVLAWV